MKQKSLISALAAAAVVVTAGVAFAQSVESLRGASVDEPVPVEDVFHPSEGRETRNFRQQPPIIPHSIEQYQIDLKANRCLSCHDWTRAGDRGAPTLSMTHYQDREGRQLDTIAGTRWFCNQCHVPQANAPELVGNTFSAGN